MLVQLCTLPWLGFVPDEVRSAPPTAAGRLADRLGVDPAALSRYGQRAQTRSDHLGMIAEYLGCKTAPAGRNLAAAGSWLTWCADGQHWAAPALPAAAKRRRENNDSTRAVSRSRIDRLCRRRDVPLREKTLWRLLDESASRASAVLALNVEDLDLPNKQARITAKGGDTMWITWGTDTAHLLPRLIAGRERGPLFLSEHRPGPHRLATTDPRDICPETGRTRLGTTAPASCSPATPTACDCTSSGIPRPPTSARPTSPPA